MSIDGIFILRFLNFLQIKKKPLRKSKVFRKGLIFSVFFCICALFALRSSFIGSILKILFGQFDIRGILYLGSRLTLIDKAVVVGFAHEKLAAIGIILLQELYEFCNLFGRYLCLALYASDTSYEYIVRYNSVARALIVLGCIVRKKNNVITIMVSITRKFTGYTLPGIM